MTTIIIEGADGAGKSTLAARLSANLGLPIIKRPRPTKLSEISYAYPEGVYDRMFFLSEWVYAPVFDREPLLPMASLLYEALPIISRRDTYLLYISPEKHILKPESRDHKDAGHWNTVIEQANYIRSRYNLMMDTLSFFGGNVTPIRDTSAPTPLEVTH